MRHWFAPVLISLALATPAVAATQEEVDQLMESLRVNDVISIMRQEGLTYARELGDEMLPGGANDRWMQSVGKIYDGEAMEDTLRLQFADSVAEKDITDAIDFFGSPLGQQVVELEVSARAALLDDAIDEASRDAMFRAMQAENPRLDLITRFIEANDLIEANVAGALNANFAFYRGMSEGGTMADMPEGEMLATVWEQVDEVRSETEEWLYSYLFMAYTPLNDEELAEYVAFSEGQTGQSMHRALFEGFDVMYVAISRALGQGIAQIRSAQDL
jgi:hypothetical protein